MTWVRDNGIVKADNTLCSGALMTLVRGNALHVMEQSVMDITVPIVGASLGAGAAFSGTGVWCAAFKTVRPFPVPVHYNSDGSFRQIKVTLDCYWSGGLGSKVKLYATSYWVSPVITDFSEMWNSNADQPGLLGSRFKNYAEASLTAGGGEKTLTFTVTPDAETTTNHAPHKTYVTDAVDRGKSAMVTWLVFDALLTNTELLRMRVIRVQDIVA